MVQPPRLDFSLVGDLQHQIVRLLTTSVTVENGWYLMSRHRDAET